MRIVYTLLLQSVGNASASANKKQNAATFFFSKSDQISTDDVDMGKNAKRAGKVANFYEEGHQTSNEDDIQIPTKVLQPPKSNDISLSVAKSSSSAEKLRVPKKTVDSRTII